MWRILVCAFQSVGSECLAPTAMMFWRICNLWWVILPLKLMVQRFISEEKLNCLSIADIKTLSSVQDCERSEEYSQIQWFICCAWDFYFWGFWFLQTLPWDSINHCRCCFCCLFVGIGSLQFFTFYRPSKMQLQYCLWILIAFRF